MFDTVLFCVFLQLKGSVSTTAFCIRTDRLCHGNEKTFKRGVDVMTTLARHTGHLSDEEINAGVVVAPLVAHETQVADVPSFMDEWFHAQANIVEYPKVARMVVAFAEKFLAYAEAETHEYARRLETATNQDDQRAALFVLQNLSIDVKKVRAMLSSNAAEQQQGPPATNVSFYVEVYLEILKCIVEALHC